MGFEMALFLMKEALAVRDQELQIPKLRHVDRRVVDFGYDSPPQRKPDLAVLRISRSHAVLVGMRPSRVHSRFPECLWVVAEFDQDYSPAQS